MATKKKRMSSLPICLPNHRTLAADAFQLLKPGGYSIASGIINQKRKEVENVLKSTGFSIFETVFMEDWITIIAQKKE